MAKKDNRYIQFYTDGSAARQLEPKVQPKKKLQQPRRKHQKKIVLHVDLLAVTGILVACVMLIMMLSGMPTGFGTIFPFILMLGVTLVAAPGVPGGAVMAALGLLESMLGFNEVQLSLMIALYLAQDSFGTACNVTGDGAIAIIVDALFGKKQNA